MTKTNIIKKLAAGLLALALVAGAAPANVGGFLTQGTAIVASAEDTTVTTAYEFTNAANKGGTVQIGADISLPYGAFINEQMTIDLNGHTITLGEYATIDVKAPLTIKDSMGAGQIISPKSGMGFCINEGGSISLESGTLKFTSNEAEGIDVWEGPFTMTGGMIDSASYSIRRDDGSVTINGGTIKGNFDGFSGELTITGGTFSFDPTPYVNTTNYAVTKVGDNWVVGEVIQKTNLSDATVEVNTTNSSVSVTLNNETINSDAYTVEYIKSGEATGTSTFPTEAGRYTAKVTAKGDSDYEGSATSAEFVINGQLEYGKTTLYANIGGINYTRIIYTVDSYELISKSFAEFVLRKGDAAYNYRAKTYYTGMTFDGVTYTPEDTSRVMFILTVKNATPDDFNWDFYI